MRKAVNSNPEQLLCAAVGNVRYWHLADICYCAAHVRFRGKADMPFCVAHVRFLTQSGHANHAPRKTGFAALARKHNNAGVCPTLYKLVLPYPGEEQMLKAFACIAVAAMSLAALAGPVNAQYPERNITLIVPYGAGGGTDVTAYAARDLEAELGKPVTVENRAGGGGWVGWARSRKLTRMATPSAISTCQHLCRLSRPPV